MKKVSFNPILTTKKLLNSIEDRPRSVLVERFGLASNSPRTLESIGREYGITRERVRQIEAFALNKIRQSEDFSAAQNIFQELVERVNEKGAVVQEDHFLDSVTKKEDHRPHVYFLLVVGEQFEKIKENDHFHHSWTVDSSKAESVKEALRRLHAEINHNSLFSEREIIAAFDKHLKNVLQEKLEEEVLLDLLKISRIVAPNALGEWGHSSSSFVRPRGMRDYAFLVMRKHGSPMHFSETAKAIQGMFDRSAHVQTVHNELIKDDRFVLVGRGLYALKEWGYEGGIVRNVIEKILSLSGPMTKDEIIKKVLKERYVKENTILVNLQNRNYFKKDEQGNYALV